MGRLSSQRLIKLHALFQFALAVSLTWTPEVITDSGLVYSAHGELRVSDIPPFTPPRSPFAYCGVLLLVFALVDLTLAVKLPALNHILTIARCIRRDGLQPHDREGEPSNVAAAALEIATEFSTLYRHLCMLLNLLRLWIFLIVSLKVYSSPESVWFGRVGPAVSNTVGGNVAISATAHMTMVEELKGKIVMGYGVMEILFSCWVRIILQSFIFLNSNDPASSSWLSMMNSVRQNTVFDHWIRGSYDYGQRRVKSWAVWVYT
ncbi:predicted protein [Uncinocarpus reesii 1704]|uniref:Uncharacterized protein n=1 Tax=Uncinocarpus reesii (strain UAMH 1704) TaxID=336963 RepID=C4JXR8_UNCRE|nr:uncharacterized protein UREG_07856 [Uncinocarpus reesii 1704]EEP82991.1 predicted protein [Uncinocarpus reesii 1704]